jgi:hypothetical protein
VWFPLKKNQGGSPLGKKAQWNDLGSWSVFVPLIFFSKNHLKNTNATKERKSAL